MIWVILALYILGAVVSHDCAKGHVVDGLSDVDRPGAVLAVMVFVCVTWPFWALVTLVLKLSVFLFVRKSLED